MSTAMQLEAHNAVAAAEATATVETVVEQMDVAGPSDEPLLSMVEQAEVDARRATQSTQSAEWLSRPIWLMPWLHSLTHSVRS